MAYLRLNLKWPSGESGVAELPDHVPLALVLDELASLVERQDPYLADLLLNPEDLLITTGAARRIIHLDSTLAESDVRDGDEITIGLAVHEALADPQARQGRPGASIAVGRVTQPPPPGRVAIDLRRAKPARQRPRPTISSR